MSSVVQERERNPRLGGGKSLEEFIAIMKALNLPYPKKMDVAVPANQRCGDLPEETLDTLETQGGKAEQG